MIGPRAALALVVLAGCSADTDQPALFTAPNLSCGQDTSSDDAKDVVERVGGLVTEEFTVTFTQGTELGVVALVDRNADRAFQVLRDDYGVVVVAREQAADDPGRVSGFAQIQQIVDATCR